VQVVCGVRGVRGSAARVSLSERRIACSVVGCTGKWHNENVVEGQSPLSLPSRSACAKVCVPVEEGGEEKLYATAQRKEVVLKERV